MKIVHFSTVSRSVIGLALDVIELLTVAIVLKTGLKNLHVSRSKGFGCFTVTLLVLPHCQV